MSDSDSDADLGVDFAAIDSQAHTNMTIEEVNKLHRQKLQAIMRSNDHLKKEVRQLKKEGQDNYRVKQIKNLRQQLRESQAIADALTKTLMGKSGMNKEEIGELYDDILSQPRLAKPNNPVKLKKDVIILQQQNQALERELQATKKLVREYRSGERRPEGEEDGPATSSTPFSPSKRNGATGGGAVSDSALAEQLRKMKLDYEISQGEVETKTRVINLHREMVSKLQNENRELRQLKLQWDLMEQAKENAEYEAKKAREEMGKTVTSTEEYHQDLRELRTKLTTLMNVRDKVERDHAAKVQALQLQISHVSERESQLLTQINLLKNDLTQALDSVAWYKHQHAQAQKQLSQRTTDSDKVWEIQQKLAVVQKELKETKLDLKAATGRKNSSESERALQERIAELRSDNSRLMEKMDLIERKYLIHHEKDQEYQHNLQELQIKYNNVLKELDSKHETFSEHKTALVEYRDRASELERRLRAGEDQWKKAQAEYDQLRQEGEKSEKLIQQLKQALQEKQKQLAEALKSGGGSSTQRTNSAESESDFLLSARVNQQDSAVQKALKKADDTHLEHIAKLMKNFELKEKELLYQIAKLQETIKPGSGNRTHLAWKNPYIAKVPVQPAVKKPPFSLDSESEEEEEEEEEDDDDLFN